MERRVAVDKMLSTNKNKIYNYIPMTIEDENIDHMVKLIRYEPLENFFSRHPSLEEYKNLLRSSQSDNIHGTRQDKGVFTHVDGKEETPQGSANPKENGKDDEDDEDEVFYSESDYKEQSVG